MLSYKIRECVNCGDVQQTLCLLDDKISVLTTSLYRSRVFLKGSVGKQRQLKDLIYYKEILQHLLYNPQFVPGFSQKDIISKIKTLV